MRDAITENLDFVIGTVTTKGPSTFGCNLTTKVKSKTVSVYVPKALVENTREMR